MRRTCGRIRKAKQQLRRRYTCDREDAQLAGVVETLPAGAVRDERVDPRTQGCQQLPALVRQALREGWDVADSAKPRIVDELLQPFYAQDGPRDPKLLIRLARLLLFLDQTQFERDHPEQARKGRRRR